MDYKDNDIKYLEDENTSIDNAMLYNKLMSLENELKEIKSNTGEKTTKADIMAIKDPIKRQKAIRENAELFKGYMVGGKVIE